MAERLGMTVGELEERMTARELREWSNYDQLVAAHREHDAMAARAARGA